MAGSSEPRGHRHDVTVWAAERLTDQRNGGGFVEDEVPDESERTAPAIDLVGHDVLGTICLEHTLVEAYDGQILDNRRAVAVAALLEERLRDRLEPPGQYTLALNTGALTGLRRRDVATTVDALEGWVRRQRLAVPTTPPPSALNHIDTPDDVPIRATLYRGTCLPEDDGKFRVSFQRDSTIEDQRAERMRKALGDKLPKLEASRKGECVTALVLEMSDYVLSNPFIVARTVYTSILALCVPHPDAIVIVDTSAGDGAWLHYLVKLSDWWSDAATDPPPSL